MGSKQPKHVSIGIFFFYQTSYQPFQLVLTLTLQYHDETGEDGDRDHWPWDQPVGAMAQEDVDVDDTMDGQDMGCNKQTFEVGRSLYQRFQYTGDGTNVYIYTCMSLLPPMQDWPEWNGGGDCKDEYEEPWGENYDAWGEDYDAPPLPPPDASPDDEPPAGDVHEADDVEEVKEEDEEQDPIAAMGLPRPPPVPMGPRPPLHPPPASAVRYLP